MPYWKNTSASLMILKVLLNWNSLVKGPFLFVTSLVARFNQIKKVHKIRKLEEALKCYGYESPVAPDSQVTFQWL